jgi:hypothetical protein
MSVDILSAASVGSNEALRAAAVEWARRGFRVFPCIPGSKKPLWEGWQQLASSDPNVVYGYWTNSANFGSPYDFNPAYCTDELVVVDLDTKDDPNVFQVFENDYYGERDTLEIETPSLGIHLVYSNPSRDVKTVGRLDKQKIDIRAVGGLAMAPGAVFKGGVYRIKADRPIQPVRDAIRGAAGKPRDRSAVTQTAASELDTPTAISHGVLLAQKTPAATIGSRGTEAYKLACRLHDIGVSEHRALEILDTHWSPRCSPPFPRETGHGVEGLEDTVSHAYEYAQNQAGSKSVEVLAGDIKFASSMAIVQAMLPPAPPPSVADERPPRRFSPGPGVKYGNAPSLSELRPRDWVFHRFLIRGEVSAMLAPGGVGKSQLGIMLSIALAQGTDFLSFRNVLQRPARSIIYNAEDSLQEMGMRFHAQCINDGIDPNLVKPFIMFVSGKEGPNSRFKITKNENREVLFNEQDVAALLSAASDVNPDCIILDPLAKIHEVNESDNSQMTRVMEAIELLGVQTGAAVMIAHHTSKASATSASGIAGNVDASRGASSIRDSARACFTLSPPTSNDAKVYGFDDRELPYFLRLDDAKMNRGIVENRPIWLRKQSIDLLTGEQVGAFSVAYIQSRSDQNRLSLTDMFCAYIIAKHGNDGGLKINDAVKVLRDSGTHWSLKQDDELRAMLRTVFLTDVPSLGSAGKTMTLKKVGNTLTFVFF